jgi:uncharacterized lipoprotein
MRIIIQSLLLTGILVACGTPEVSRYRDTEHLERPPKVESSNASKEQNTTDNSSIPKQKDSTGLGKDVYLSNPAQLTIKQSFGDAWNTLNRALKQSGLKITDHERAKGLYYVTKATASDDTGFFGKLTTFLANDPAIYLLTVKQQGEETTVTVTIANTTEQSAVDTNGGPHPSTEGAEELLQLLFKTLRDDLKEE